MTLQTLFAIQLANSAMLILLLVLICVNLYYTRLNLKRWREVKAILDAGISISVSGPYRIDEPDEAEKPKYDA